MKFKVGDIVRANELSNDRYSITNSDHHWYGKVTAVNGNKFDAVTTDCIREGMDLDFKNLEQEYFNFVQITVVYHSIAGNRTIVKLSDGRKGIAKCDPNDEFDVYEGLRIATARAFGKTDEEIFGKKTSMGGVEPQCAEPRVAKVGDYVKVIANNSTHQFKINDIVKCVYVDTDRINRFESLDGEIEFWLTPDEYIILPNFKPEFNPVGKMVTVVDKGETYAHYTKWIKKNFPEYLEKHCYGGSPIDGYRYVVRGVAPHNWDSDEKLYLIQDAACYIIGKDGIRFDDEI